MVDVPQLDHSLPLIICDADEVLLQFMQGFESFLHTQGFFHDFSSFRIHGNVRDFATKNRAGQEKVDELFASFFATRTRHLTPVPGAADALRALSTKAQVIVLSNLPSTSRAARIDNLRDLGMPYPVIAGKGPKGLVVKSLIQEHAKPVVFIDDLPPHLTSVANETPHVHRLHFVADPRLAKLIPRCPDAHERIDNWTHAQAWISKVLEQLDQ